MDKLFVANLKMNFTNNDSSKYKEVFDNENFNNLVVCPSFVHLNLMKSGSYILGSQDGFYEDIGQYTSNISFLQLKDIGVKYSIIGHSETRKFNGDTTNVINKKITASLRNKIIPIVCIGETIEDKKSGNTLNVIKKELSEILQDIKLDKIIIAYEPVWAIGSNEIPSLYEIEEVHLYIKSFLKKEFNIEADVLYGGSVNLSNVKEIIKNNGVDGVLIGGASKDPNNLIQMIKECKVNV